MNEETSLIDLTNPPFTLKIGDKELQVKQASITQLQQFFNRKSETEKRADLSDDAKALEIASYAIFLIANASDSSITEDWARDSISGLSNPLPVLVKLGFLDPRKVELMDKIQQELILKSSSQQ